MPPNRGSAACRSATRSRQSCCAAGLKLRSQLSATARNPNGCSLPALAPPELLVTGMAYRCACSTTIRCCASNSARRYQAAEGQSGVSSTPDAWSRSIFASVSATKFHGGVHQHCFPFHEVSMVSMVAASTDAQRLSQVMSAGDTTVLRSNRVSAAPTMRSAPSAPARRTS